MLEVIKELRMLLRDYQLGNAAEMLRGASVVYLVGNGGSSSTMSHLASDLNNLGLYAICLTDNIPRLTALVNDYGWDEVYNRMQEQRNLEGSVLVVASVNGSKGVSDGDQAWSANLYSLAKMTLEKGGKVLSLIGNKGGELKKMSTLAICLESKDPYIVEGVHSVIAHMICKELKR